MTTFRLKFVRATAAVTIPLFLAALAIGAGWTRTALFLVAAAMVMLILMSLWLLRNMADPLELLAQSAKAAPLSSEASMAELENRSDEFGIIARERKAREETTQDIERLSHEKLSRTERTASAVLNAIPYAGALISLEGVIEIVNVAGIKLGWLRGMRVADSPWKWFPALVDAALSKPVAPAGRDAAAQGANKPRFPLVQMFEGNRELFFLPQVQRVVGENGELFGVIIVLVDMTDARETSEAKSGLLSAVSHQLKTPMTSIQMSIHLLLEDSIDRLSPRHMELMRAAAAEADRLQGQIEELLASARGRS